MARADVSGWAHVGAGISGYTNETSDGLLTSPTMTIDMGAGTADGGPFVIGGLFRMQPVFHEGLDLALLARIATRGFQSEMFGLAFDVGGYQQTYGFSSTGFIGQISLGLPLGLQLAANGSVGNHDVKSFGVTLGIDFARLTVHRAYGIETLPSPRPEKALRTATNK